MLIAMAIYDTEENQRSTLTARCLENLFSTIDDRNHRVFLIDNASCPETKTLLRRYRNYADIITNPENIGTAEAINLAWRHRQPGEACVKMDNDVIIHSQTWADELQEAINRDPRIGIVGLKRKDCIEHPERPESDFYRSELYHLPHQPGEKWIVAERVNHVIGTCQAYSPALLDKIGYLYQPRLYGFDDALAAVRCKVANMWSAFLPHIEIDHIDPGDTEYQGWKEKHAGEDMAEYNRLATAYLSGAMSIYYNPFQ
jgi:GT2 family glycosyltransferase